MVSRLARPRTDGRSETGIRGSNECCKSRDHRLDRFPPCAVGSPYRYGRGRQFGRPAHGATLSRQPDMPAAKRSQHSRPPPDERPPTRHKRARRAWPTGSARPLLAALTESSGEPQAPKSGHDGIDTGTAAPGVMHPSGSAFADVCFPRRTGPEANERFGGQTQPGPGLLLARRRLAPLPRGAAIGRRSGGRSQLWCWVATGSPAALSEGAAQPLAGFDRSASTGRPRREVVLQFSCEI